LPCFSKAGSPFTGGMDHREERPGGECGTVCIFGERGRGGPSWTSDKAAGDRVIIRHITIDSPEDLKGKRGKKVFTANWRQGVNEMREKSF